MGGVRHAAAAAAAAEAHLPQEEHVDAVERRNLLEVRDAVRRLHLQASSKARNPGERVKQSEET